MSLERLKYLSIMTTSKCTSGCVYCPYPYSWATKNPGYMEDDLFEKIIKDVAETYPDFHGYYTFQNGNEPTADPKFIERIRFIYKYLPHVQLNFPTNANLLWPDKGRQLIDIMYENDSDQITKAGMRILVHFSGIDKKSWQKTMRTKETLLVSYEKTIENIRSLLKYNTQKGLKLQDNRQPHETVLNYKHEGVTGTELAHFNRHGTPHALHIGIGAFVGSEGHEIEFYTNEEHQEYVNELFGDCGGFLAYSMRFHNRAGDLKLMDQFIKDAAVRKIDKDNPFRCARFFDGKALHVLHNGEVTICCNDWQRITAIGDLSKQTITEFFNSKEYKNLMDMGHGRIESPADFICKRCTDFQAMEDMPD